MKSFDNLDKNIDKYYDDNLDSSNLEEAELKTVIDKMTIANEIENIVSIPTDVISIIEKGQEVRLKNKLRRETLKFLPIALLFTIIIGFVAINSSLTIMFEIQIVLLISLLTLLIIVQGKNKRREQN